jgi:PAS domain S-box-containing protein
VNVPNTTTLAERYRDLFEGALLGIYVSQPDGRLVACNAAFARLLGFESIAHAIGASMSDVLTTEREPSSAAFAKRGGSSTIAAAFAAATAGSPTSSKRSSASSMPAAR